MELNEVLNNQEKLNRIKMIKTILNCAYERANNFEDTMDNEVDSYDSLITDELMSDFVNSIKYHVNTLERYL